jgi:hypothetical protein
VLLIAYPWLMMRMVARRLGLAGRPVWTYRITPTDFTISSPVADTTVRWEQVRLGKESPDAWALRLRSGSWLVLPKDAFDPAQRSRVTELVAAAGRVQPTA